MRRMAAMIFALVMALSICSTSLAAVEIISPASKTLDLVVGQSLTAETITLDITTALNGTPVATPNLPAGLNGILDDAAGTYTISGKVATGTTAAGSNYTGPYKIEFDDDDGITDTLIITVTQGPSTLTQLPPVTMTANTTKSTPITLKDIAGDTIPSVDAPTYVFTSSTPTTANVTTLGQITAMAAGTTEITVTFTGNSDYLAPVASMTFTVTVNAAAAPVVQPVQNNFLWSYPINMPAFLPTSQSTQQQQQQQQQAAQPNKVTGSTAVKRVPVYSGTGRGKKVLGRLAQDTEFTILGIDGDYYMVNFSGGDIGYISMASCNANFKAHATVSRKVWSYEGMSTKSKYRVMQLDKGEAVEIAARFRSWYAINVDGDYVFVQAKYIRLIGT